MTRVLLFLLICVVLTSIWYLDMAQQYTRTRRIRNLRADLVTTAPPVAPPILPSNPVLTWEEIFDMATLYHHGSYPHYRPDKEKAASLYNTILAKCDNPSIRQFAQLRLVDCLRRPKQADDIAGETLPSPPPIAIQQQQPQEEERPFIPNDRQNAHDHGVTTSIAATLRQVASDTTLPRVPGKTKILEMIADPYVDMSDEEKAKAIVVLESLGNTQPHSLFEMTENEALDMVVSKIESLENEELKRNVLETVCKQLASGFEHGTVVCTTGKITRLVSALDGIPETTTVTKPLWAVKEELASLATAVRTEVLKQAEKSHDGDATELEDSMKARFREKAIAVYCDDLGLSKDMIEPMLVEISHGF